MASEIVKCSNCKRDVSASNYNLHIAHCEKRITLCQHCDEPVVSEEMDQHMQETHARIFCKKCHIGMECWQLEDHEKYCPKRIQECQYCELPRPFDELGKHEDQCGSRTEKCSKCQQYVLLKDADNHFKKLCVKRLVRCNLCKLQLPCDQSREHSVWCVARKKIDMSEENESIGHAPLTNQFPELDSLSYEKKRIQEEHYLPKRIQECQYCDLEFPFDELGKHEEQCGAQTEKCPNCHQYVLLKDADNHLEKLCIKKLVCCYMCNLQLPYDEFKEHCVRCVARKKMDMSEENESICRAPLTNQLCESDPSPYGFENQHCSSLELDESNKCSEEPAQNDVSVDNEKFTLHGQNQCKISANSVQNQCQPETSCSGEHETCPLCGAPCLVHELCDHIAHCDAHIFICFYCKQNVPVTQTKNHSKTCSHMASLHFTKMRHKTQDSDDEIFVSSSEETEGFHKCSNSVAANSLLPASQENGGSTKSCVTSVHSNQGGECVASASVTGDCSKRGMPRGRQKKRLATHSACTFCTEEVSFKNYLEHRKVCRERHSQKTQETSDEHSWEQRELHYINGGSQTSEHAGLGNAGSRCSERNGANRKPDEEHNSGRQNRQNPGTELPTHFICAFCKEEITFKNYIHHHSICRGRHLQQTQETSGEHSLEQRELRYINEGGSEENRCSERNVAKRKTEQECEVTDPLAAVHPNPMWGTALPTAPLEDLPSSRSNSRTEEDEICEFCGSYVMNMYFGEHVAMCGGSITKCPLCGATMTNFDKKDHHCDVDAPPQNCKEDPRRTEHVVSSNEKKRSSKRNNTKRRTEEIHNSSKQNPVAEGGVVCEFCGMFFIHSVFDQHIACCGNRFAKCSCCKSDMSLFDLKEHRCAARDATQSSYGINYDLAEESKENALNEETMARLGYHQCFKCKEYILVHKWGEHLTSCGLVVDTRKKDKNKNETWTSAIKTAIGSLVANPRNNGPESYMQKSVKNKGSAGRGNPYDHPAGRGNPNNYQAGRGNPNNYQAGRENSNNYQAGRGNPNKYQAGRRNPNDYQAGRGYNSPQARIRQTQDLDDQQKDVLIPCEFCECVIPADEIIIHESGCNPEMFVGLPSTEKNDLHAETVQAHRGRDYSEGGGDTSRNTSHQKGHGNCVGYRGGDDVAMEEITENFQNMQVTGTSGLTENQNTSNPITDNERSSGNEEISLERFKFVGRFNAKEGESLGSQNRSCEVETVQQISTTRQKKENDQICDPRLPQRNSHYRDRSEYCGCPRCAHTVGKGRDPHFGFERKKNCERKVNSKGKSEPAEGNFSETDKLERNTMKIIPAAPYNLKNSQIPNAESGEPVTCNACRFTDQRESTHDNQTKPLRTELVKEVLREPECNNQKGSICGHHASPRSQNCVPHGPGYDYNESVHRNRVEISRIARETPRDFSKDYDRGATQAEIGNFGTKHLEMQSDAKACDKCTEPAWNNNKDAQPRDTSKKTWLTSKDKNEINEIQPLVECHNRKPRTSDTKNNANRNNNSCSASRHGRN